MAEDVLSEPAPADGPGAALELETDTDVDALGAAVRAEHAAVHGYEFIGASSTGGRRDRARVCVDRHRDLRDALRAEMAVLGAAPPVAALSHPLPEDRRERDLDGFAAELEEATARAYLRLAASRSPGLRVLAAHALQETAVQALLWGGELPPFPGFPQE